MSEEQLLATDAARLKELWSLVAAFGAQDNKPPQQWIVECISAVGVAQLDAKSLENGTDLLVILAIAMWQAGYEAVPKLEFVLPKGAGR